MQQRNPIAVAVLAVITFGVYAIYWIVKTKEEMNQRGADIPTAWLIIVPFVNIWWLWKYSEGVEKVTNAQLSTVISFILLFVLDVVGMAVIQNSFNKHTSASGAPEMAAAPVQPQTTAPTQPPANDGTPDMPNEDSPPPTNDNSPAV